MPSEDPEVEFDRVAADIELRRLQEAWTPSHQGVTTTSGRAYALKCLAWRRAHKPEKIDNGSLYAGSPMYFYCNACGHVSDVLPEGYIMGPSHICEECVALKQFGWLE